MALQQITASDIAGWDSLSDVAATLEKRGLKPRPNLGEDNELVMQLADDEFVVLVEAGPGESATDFKPKDVDRRHTNLVATNDFEEFTFITRVRTFGQQHGQIKHQKLSFSKSQFKRDGGEKHTVLQKLNDIEYGSAAAIYDDLYDTRQIVSEFYEQFEDLRTDLVREVTGIPEGHGDDKRRYVQVTLDRMIFLYFIQEKRLLDRDPEYLHDRHEAIVAEGGDVYEEFYHPLFFEMLAEGKQDPKFGKLPYLNGGLFSTNPIEEKFDEAKLGDTTERTNELFGRILDFLSEWNWNVDERLDIVDPKNLSPAVLGHIFEQTVNQKEMGAYYTPEEITGFMARRSIHPYLLDELEATVGVEYEAIDEVFGLGGSAGGGAGAEAVADGGTITHQGATEDVATEHVETLYFDVLQDVRVLDPAVGSGAFLLAAQDVLLDVYLQCLEFFEAVESEGMAFELQNRTREELEKVQDRKASKSLYAKRQIILNNLYGVDIDDGAVEICKLRLWLSMVADIEDEPGEVEPLPNIDFNIRQGNSLIGFIEAVNPREVGEGNTDVGNWSRYGMYSEVVDAIRKHKSATTTEEATEWRQTAEKLIEEHRGEFDSELRREFQDAGIENISIDEIREYSPFHWPLEFAQVYDEGGFNIVIGNPPWDVLSASSDEFFARYKPDFRSLTQQEKDDYMEDQLNDEGVANEWDRYQQEVEMQTEYFKNSNEYQLQTPEVDGETATYKNDLSKLFFERAFNLICEGGYVSQVLPGLIVNGEGAKDLRMEMLNNSNVDAIVEFENSGIFDIHGQQRFAVVVFESGGYTETLRGVFDQKDTTPFRNIGEFAIDIPRRVLAEYSPEARIFPWVKTQEEVEVLDTVLKHPSLSADIPEAWSINLLPEELNETRDKRRGYFAEDIDKPDYPVYTGKNIWQYHYDGSIDSRNERPIYWSVEESVDPERSAKRRIREKRYNSGEPKKAIYESFGGPESSKSQIAFVNDLLQSHRDEELGLKDVLLDCSEYRIAYRDVTTSTNERTVISTVLPKDIVCVHTLATFRPFKIDPGKDDLSESPLHSVYTCRLTDRELFVAVGLLNSMPFDYLMRTKTDKHLVEYKLLESKMPRLTDGDDWFHYISDRAARLNCYGEDFAEMRERLGGIDPATDTAERRELQAEIDAAAFHAYGLDREEVQFVLEDFHRVENPRLMDEPYFEMVAAKYDELAEEGPKP